MNKVYSYGKQTIEPDDIQTVVDVLKSDWLTQGPTVSQFEDSLCDKLGAEFACAVANGTAALHLVGLALGWSKQDVILTTPITFLATANCILYSGAIPDFVDIDPVSYTIDPNRLEDKVQDYLQKGQRVKAVIGVDYAGHPCDWQALRFLADKYNFQLINDACHALGASYKNDSGYAMKYADVAVYSFHPVKHITTGEGGAILTNEMKIDETVKRLHTHGMTKDKRLIEKDDGPWYYEVHELGFNYRITDLQCALGISQVKKLDHFVSRRRQIAGLYDEVFRPDGRFVIPEASDEVYHAYHLYPLRIKFDHVRVSRKDLFAELKTRNILAQVHYIPIHLQPYYRQRFGFRMGQFPLAEEYYKQEVSIPIYPSLDKQDIVYIADSINIVVNS